MSRYPNFSVTDASVFLLLLFLFPSRLLLSISLWFFSSSLSQFSAVMATHTAKTTDTNQHFLLDVNMTNVTKLTPSNYLMWSLQVHALLNVYDLASYLDSTSRHHHAQRHHDDQSGLRQMEATKKTDLQWFSWHDLAHHSTKTLQIPNRYWYMDDTSCNIRQAKKRSHQTA